MVWVQIILFSLMTGFCLSAINRIKVPRNRWVWRAIFLVIVSTAASGLIGIQQVPGDEARLMFENSISLFPLVFVYTMEAILISVLIEKYVSNAGIVKFLAIYLPCIFLTVFFTTVLVIGVYPGS